MTCRVDCSCGCDACVIFGVHEGDHASRQLVESVREVVDGIRRHDLEEDFELELLRYRFAVESLRRPETEVPVRLLELELKAARRRMIARLVAGTTPS